MTEGTKYKYFCQPGDYPRYEMNSTDFDNVAAMKAGDVLRNYFGLEVLRFVFEDETGEDYIDIWDRVEIIATPEEIVRRLVAWNHKDGSSLVKLTAEAEKVVRSLDKALD